MYLATISIFDWNLGLFDLYPPGTAARFMYAAVPGLAVCLGWIIDYMQRRFRLEKMYKIIALPLLVLFIAGNFAIIQKISTIYFDRQKLSGDIIMSFERLNDEIINARKIIVAIDDKLPDPPINDSPAHLHAILNAYFRLNRTVEEKTSPEIEALRKPDLPDSVLFLKWNISSNSFQPIS
jgi:hypothetical protein